MLCKEARTILQPLYLCFAILYLVHRKSLEENQTYLQLQCAHIVPQDLTQPILVATN
jgi:hypothetical protein